ncbi:hypothetical protein NLX83_29480 [Allokutzneria sp. A3M-2-11 16]|uniref:hypothetical protein n=1 Tax=Allokutzneria sp. A3M-2-11 16 TaxID=2962043 RepID=UPI0020B6D381|nr:hypothetical protein [Allokutzneria sp. A3M-2-11 16]MCP3803414.1 hypothetical protein [Allokutzneria sp. A3M-2-11 16]
MTLPVWCSVFSWPLPGGGWTTRASRVRLQVDAAPASQTYRGESGHKIVLVRIDNHLGDVQGYAVRLGRGVDSDAPHGRRRLCWPHLLVSGSA